MNYKDLNKLFNDSSYKYAGSAAAYARLGKRKWKLRGKQYTIAGIAPAKGEKALRLVVHFTCNESLPEGGVFHTRIMVDIGDALDCLSGDLVKALERSA